MCIYKSILKTALIISVLLLFGTGCAKKEASKSETESVTEIVTTEEVTTTSETTTSTTTTTTTTTTITFTDTTPEEAEIVRALEFADDIEDNLILAAENLSERYLGAVIDEEDAIAAARSVLLEKFGQSYVDYIESEYVDFKGEQVRITERKNPPYIATYYEEYDVWSITETPPVGTLENGKNLDIIWDHYGSIIIRASDGKVLCVP